MAAVSQSHHFQWLSAGPNDENSDFCIKSLIVLVEANDGHDEAKLRQLIVSVFPEKREAARDTGIVTSREVSVLTVQKGSYLGCGECSDTQRISRSVFHKAKRSQDTFKSFSLSLFTPCFFLSLFFPSIATLPGGERREEEEEVRT